MNYSLINNIFLSDIFPTIRCSFSDYCSYYWRKASQIIYSGKVVDAENCNYRKKSVRTSFLFKQTLTKSSSTNLEGLFMNKLWSAAEQRPARADEIFREELCRVPHRF